MRADHSYLIASTIHHTSEIKQLLEILEKVVRRNINLPETQVTAEHKGGQKTKPT